MQSVFEITSAIASGSSDADALVDAFSRLYDSKFDFVHRLIVRKTGVDESAAMDIVQETMMRVIRHIKPMRTEADLDAWLTRVALNASYDRLRADRRRRAREMESVNHRNSIESVQNLVGMSANVEALREEIAALDVGSFDLLSMRFRAGMTLEAIGRRLGVGAGAADGRLRRVLAQLQQRLEEQEL